MDQKIFNEIKKASENSITNPGKSKINLPKEVSDLYPKIYLFRHGETYDNKHKIFSGWRDSNLTERGKKQAEALSHKIRTEHIDICITSPLKRTIETAKIALKYNKNVVFEQDERIIERNYGSLSGQSKEKLMQNDPVLAIKYRRGYDFPPPHGESLKMVEERVFPFCEDLILRIKEHNINVAISAHGNSMRAIRKYFEKLSLLEELTMENPLATDYCRYVVKVIKNKKDKGHFNKNQLKKLFIAKDKIFAVLRPKLNVF